MHLVDRILAAGLPADAPAVHWRETTLSRGALAAAVDRVAATLHRMGVAPGTAVAAHVPDTPLGLVMVLGIWRAGAVPAPLDAARTAAELDALVAEVRPAAVVRASLDCTSLVPLVSARPGEPRHYGADVALLLTAPDPVRPSEPDESAAGPDRTDGAEGPMSRPSRRVQWTHRALAGAVDATDDTVRARAGGIVALPVASAPGLDAALGALVAGGSVALLAPCSPAALADAVRRHGAEAVTIDRVMIDALVEDPAVTTLEPVRYLRCVGGAISPDDVRRVRTRFGVTALGSYGRPEYGGEVVGWTIGDAAVDGDLKPGSAGRPVAGVELRVLRRDRTPADAGETGELWVRSPFAMAGYVTDRVEPGTRVDADGFVHVGDHGHVDRDGFLWIDPGIDGSHA